MRDAAKEKYVGILTEILSQQGEDVLRVESNQIAFPIVHDNGEEDFINIVVKIPTGSNKGTEPYDGYELAQAYEMKQKEKEEKAKRNAEAKAKKIARDEKYRAKKAEQQEKRG